MIRRALATTADEAGYLDSDFACEAVAAAAIVASTLPGGEPIKSVYASDFLVEGGLLELDNDLPALAVRALDRVMADESEWRSLWADATRDGRNPAFDGIASLRAVLSAAS